MMNKQKHLIRKIGQAKATEQFGNTKLGAKVYHRFEGHG